VIPDSTAAGDDELHDTSTNSQDKLRRALIIRTRDSAHVPPRPDIIQNDEARIHRRAATRRRYITGG